MKKLIYRFNSISLRTRLMLGFALLIIVPLLVQGLISLSILSDSVLDRYQSEMEYRFSQLDDRVDELFVECRSVLLDFAYQKDIQKILKDEYENEGFIRSRYIVEELLLDGRMSYSGIQFSIFVYDMQGNCYTNDYLNMITYEEVLSDKEILETHINSNIMLEKLMSEQGFRDIIMGRPIFDSTGRDRIGTVVIRINAEHLKELYRDTFKGSGAAITVVNQDGIIISSERYAAGTPAAEQLKLAAPLEYDSVLERADDVLFTSQEDSRSWIYVAQMDSSVVNQARHDMQLTTYIMIIIVLALSALVLFYISAEFVHPIKLLTESIQALDSAETAELTFKPKYNDEIGRLARSYNDMTVKLKASVEKIKQIEKDKQRAEIKMLEAQISPHFLYNTLSSIIWLVHKDKKNEAIGMMEALARLYQISLSRGREIITLQQEFEHAESYLKIQEKRYHGNFEYALYMDEGIGKFSVVKVVLQPLIENAIYHGVRKMSEGGSIIVRGSCYGEDRILLSVMDNGNMLGEEGCEKMNKALAGSEEGVLGVGVSNVMARLRLYYGEDCSMRYVMRDGFTVVEIEIPIREMNGDV